nr:matrixin family metalloprotease [Lactobacillus colini]
MIAFGLNFAYQKSGPWLEKYFGTENPIPYLTMQVQSLINNKKVIQVDQESTTQDKTTHRFVKPSANVYVAIKNQELRQAAIDAMNVWNNTGSFTFKMVESPKNAQIIIKKMNDSSTNAAGLTTTSYNSVTGYLLKATVRLNEYYLLNPEYGYSNQRIVNTAEHELGHAIGLEHNHGISVMYPQGSYYTIQPRDVAAVEKLYKEKSSSAQDAA